MADGTQWTATVKSERIQLFTLVATIEPQELELLDLVPVILDLPGDAPHELLN